VKEKQGMIFDIQSYSVHDGPGCRTLVFMSGCPMRCQWCANPEGWDLRQRLLYRVSKCINRSRGCERCVAACPYKAITIVQENEVSIIIDRNKCKNCKELKCTAACLNEALIICGKWYREVDLMRIFNRDRNFWGSTGGVTFTGGEPFVQKEFLLAILKRCKEAYIHTALETTLHTGRDTIFETMKHVDFVFTDIKHMNSDRHKELTGVSNETILRNIASLALSNWPGRLVLRMPVIEGFNDTEENAKATALFMNRLGLKEMNLLPFHRMGESKWRQLGMTYPYAEMETTSDEVLGRLQDIYLDNDILCYVGSDTPF